jgi:uncharacterized integral membrane protein
MARPRQPRETPPPAEPDPARGDEGGLTGDSVPEFRFPGDPPSERSSTPAPAEPAAAPVEPVEPAVTPAEPAAPAAPARQTVPRTRTGIAFNGLIVGALILILLLVFILENTKSVKITYFGAGFHAPLGVALLIAAIAGALIVGVVGGGRILQLRKRARRPQAPR